MRPKAWASLMFVVALLWLVAQAAPAQAQAEPSAAVLFEEGQQHMAANELDAACAKFQASEALEARALTALELGLCFERRGMFASAWSAFARAASLAQQAGQEERENLARTKLAAMEQQVARLTIAVSASTPTLTVTLNGEVIAEALFGRPLPIDPGIHQLSATAPGRKPWRREVEIHAERADVTVDVPALDPVAAPAPPSPPPSSPRPRGPKIARAAAPPPVMPSPLAYVGFAVGGVGLMVGAITGIVAIENTRTISDSCTNDLCPANLAGALDDAEVVANVSNVAFGVGGLGVVLGVIGLFVGGEAPERAAKASLRPVVGPGYAGLEGRF